MDNLINWGQDQRVFSCTWILPPHKYIYGFKRMTISYYCTLRRYSFTPQSCILMPAQWRMSWNPPSIAALLQNAWLRCIYSKKNLGTIIYSTKWGGAEGHRDIFSTDIFSTDTFSTDTFSTGHILDGTYFRRTFFRHDFLKFKLADDHFFVVWGWVTSGLIDCDDLSLGTHRDIPTHTKSYLYDDFD